MATVVLLGCSTSGKSSAARRVRKRDGSPYEVIDTDAVVAADSEFQGHHYAMFLKFTRGADISAAQLYLEIGERYLLRQLQTKQDSILIAAGPNVPLRDPDWSRFRAAVNPICIYFRLSAAELYRGLRQRRQRQRQRGLDLCPGFGSWDKGLATEFNEQTDAWDELPEAEALSLIQNHLNQVEPIYLSNCEPQHVFDVGSVKQDRDLQDRITATLLTCLEWMPLAQSASHIAV